jgi:hypothetical protein
MRHWMQALRRLGCQRRSQIFWIRLMLARGEIAIHPPLLNRRATFRPGAEPHLVPISNL